MPGMRANTVRPYGRFEYKLKVSAIIVREAIIHRSGIVREGGMWGKRADVGIRPYGRFEYKLKVSAIIVREAIIHRAGSVRECIQKSSRNEP